MKNENENEELKMKIKMKNEFNVCKQTFVINIDFYFSLAVFCGK